MTDISTMMSNAIGLIFLVCTLRVMCIVSFALGVSSGSIVNYPINQQR